jgi:5-methylthioadenosine/S-adenosylhomocysteine deaminase
MSTVKVLNTHGLLDSNLIAAHIHDTSSQERELLVNKGVHMVGCPSSISMIDGTVPPIAHYLSIGGVAAIGTDQAPGPGHHNMIREVRTISLLSKILNKNPTILPAWEALKLSTVNGSKVLGLESKIGTLEVGKQADLITIDLKKVNLTPTVYQPFYNFVPNLVYSIIGNEVDNVIINGKIIMRDYNFINLDEEKLIEEANKAAKRIFELAEEDWLLANSKLVESHRKGYL